MPNVARLVRAARAHQVAARQMNEAAVSAIELELLTLAASDNEFVAETANSALQVLLDAEKG